MAVFVLRDASVTVNAVNLSQYVQAVTLNYEVDQVSIDSMGITGHLFTGGLQNISIDITFNQDFAASTVAPTLDALIGVPTTVAIKPTSAATSATNPLYTVSSTLLTGTQPVSGSVGDLAQMTASFVGGSLVKTTS